MHYFKGIAKSSNCIVIVVVGSAVAESFPSGIMTEAGHVGNQCVTIVTDAISCGSEVLGDQRTDDTDPDDSGN